MSKNYWIIREEKKRRDKCQMKQLKKVKNTIIKWKKLKEDRMKKIREFQNNRSKNQKSKEF